MSPAVVSTAAPSPIGRLLCRFPLQIGPTCARDGRGDTATVAQLRIGCVGDRVEFELGYVSLDHL
jgi:hypothetical protein